MVAVVGMAVTGVVVAEGVVAFGRDVVGV